MKAFNLTASDFENLPQMPADFLADAIVLIPGTELHESGYRMINFVAIETNLETGTDSIYKVGSFDFIDINKINETIQTQVSLDMLLSGLIRLLTHSRQYKIKMDKLFTGIMEIVKVRYDKRINKYVEIIKDC